MTGIRTWRKTRIMLKHRVHGDKGVCENIWTIQLSRCRLFKECQQIWSLSSKQWENIKYFSPPKGVSELALVWRMNLKNQDWIQEDHLGVYDSPSYDGAFMSMMNLGWRRVSTQTQNICFKVESIKLYYWLTMRSEWEILVKYDAHSILLENWVVPIR